VTGVRIDPRTHMGPVHYTVRDLERMTDFYCRVLGFQLLQRQDDTVSLGVAAHNGAATASPAHTIGTGERASTNSGVQGGTELLRLTRNPAAQRYPRTAGLYHTAFLVPTKWDLAHLVRRIIDTRSPVHGHSNHGTHLAIYLPDPEGNGIELAWDFPREQWPMENGRMLYDRMPREGVDIGALLEELERDPSPWPGLPVGTVVGHIHLHVSELSSTKHFYHEVLGFDVTMESEEWGALFMSAGGYHHHIGSNVWKGIGIPPAPPDALGLRWFTILVPDEAVRATLLERAATAGVPTEPHPEGTLLRDPSGIGVLLAVAEPSA